MQKMIVVDPSRCTGCRSCELVCTVKHEGVSNPSRARIKVIKWEFECFEIPMLCQQCESALCAAVCPTHAISRDEEMGRMSVNYDSCIGCKMCVLACPFGAMKYDVIAKKVSKCDLCDGDPTCVKYCEPKALEWVNVTDVNTRKQREAASKGYQLRKEQKEAIGPESGHPGDYWPDGFEAWHPEAYIPRKSVSS